MPSSVIRQFSYDERTEQLSVTFVSGRVYIYYQVPQAVHEAFRTAPSKGQFFNIEIRDRYAFREVTAGLNPRKKRSA